MRISPIGLKQAPTERAPARAGKSLLWGRLWVQVALLLIVAVLLLFVVAVASYNTYWEQVLGSAPSEVRAYIEQVRPTARTALEGLPGRPVLRVFLLSALVIGVMSTLVTRWLLRPLSALEKATRRIAGGELEVRGQVRGQVWGRGEVGDLGRNIGRIAAQLEKAEGSRRLWSAAVAHELRTPVAALRARVEALEHGVFPLSSEEVARLHPNLDLLERLCEDLATLTLSEAGQLELHPQTLELRALAQDVLHDFQARADKAEVVLELKDLTPDSRLQADPQRVRQIVGNLLENALKHVPAGGRIQVRLERRGEGQKLGSLLMSVEDSGPGVPSELLESLFTPFWRADPSRARSSGGSGLGLAVVRALVEAHRIGPARGTVTASRSSLGGLAVRVLWPLEDLEWVSSSAGETVKSSLLQK